MRMLVVIAALVAAPAAFAGEAWFDPAVSAVSDPRVALDMPVQRVPGRALVKLDGIDPHDLSIASPRAQKAQKALLALAERSGVVLELVRPSLLGWGLFDVRDLASPKQRPTEARTLALIERLAADPAVAGATGDRWYRTQTLPSDPAVADMWHLSAIGAPAAWDFTTGNSSQRIGVVDTGTLRDHVELSAKAVSGYDFISSGNAAGDGDGRDADYNDEGDGADCGFGYQPDSFHGSHVAGTILASTNNGAGIAGINWGASLVTARAMGKCGGALSDIMEGAAWLAGASIDGVPAVGGDKVSVMNLSLGGDGGCSDFEQDVIDFINDQGVIFVAAAGNNGGSVGSPANCNTVVSVAAHGPGANKPLAPYSSFGSTIEVVAPGGLINGTPENGILSLTGPGTDDYTWQQGTSMAAPHVTGAISLLQVFDATLTRGDLAELFDDNGDDCSGCNGVPALRVDLLLEAIGATAQPPVDEPPVEDEPPTSEPPSANDDALEPNGAWDERAPVTCGDDLSLFMAEGDVDWFSFTVAASTDVEVSVVSGVDLDLFVTVGPQEADVLDASTTENGLETVTLASPGAELGIAVLPWMEASGSYRLLVHCGGDEQEPADPVEDPADPPSDVPADDVEEPSAPPADSGEAGAPAAEAEQEGTMTRAEQLNGGLRGGCSQASGSAAPLALLLVGVVALSLRPRRRRRAAASLKR